MTYCVIRAHSLLRQDLAAWGRPNQVAVFKAPADLYVLLEGIGVGPLDIQF